MQHNVWDMSVDPVSSKTAGPFVAWPFLAGVMVISTKCFIIMNMARALGCKEHLDTDDDEYSHHCYQAGHGRVALVPKVWEAWVSQRLKSGREEVYEGGCNKHAGAKVSRYKKERVGDGEGGKSLDDDGKGACCRQSQCELAAIRALDDMVR